MAGRFSPGLQFTTAFFVVMLFACSKPRLTIIETRTISYPSGSSAAFHGDKFFLAGDDARSILVTDRSFNISDSIIIYGGEGRISKTEKHDLEAMAMVGKRKSRLLILGSGSDLPLRGYGLLVDPVSKDTQQIDLNPLYNRFKQAGLKELNIEGAAYVQGTMILSNRGHQASRHNHLIFLPDNFWINQDSVEFSIARLGFNSGDVFNGISGMDYSFLKDKLLVTVSTEMTSGTTTDGAIGKSYLWIVDNIIRSRSYAGINPSLIIDLEEADPGFKGHKIQSVSIISDKGKRMELILVSDNDDGNTTLFRVMLDAVK